MAILRPAPLLVFLAALAAACTDDPSTPLALPPPPGAPDGGVRMECRADVRAARMACAPTSSGSAGGASADLLLGGQETYVRLASDSIVVGGGVFSTRVTVQNLTVQALGTGDGTTLSPRGVRVFFHGGPTNGVEVANPDGVEMFTGPAQPYFQYDGILQPQQVSAEKTWSFDLNGETDSFSFQLLVVAPVPSEAGFLRMEQVEGVDDTGGADLWMDGATAIAVGGVILRSLDGGRHWARMNSGGAPFLSAVWGVASTLVAVGPDGAIYRSTTRGSTWKRVDSGTAQGLRGVWGRGSTFVAVGAGGTLLRSIDGGAAWTGVASGTTKPLNDIWGEDSMVVAVGDGGTILRSRDGGATWAAVASGTTMRLGSVWGKGAVILAAGEEQIDPRCREGVCSTLLRSADGGGSWAATLLDNPEPVGSLWGRDSVMLAGIGRYNLDSGGEIYRSDDLGVTWSQTHHGGSGREIHCMTGWDSVVLVMGSDDAVGSFRLRSPDGGRRWEGGSRSRDPLYATWSDGATAVAVGVSYGVLQRSADGGTTWSRTYLPSSAAASLHGVWGRDSIVVAVGAGGMMIRSVNRAVGWTELDSGTTKWLRDVSGDGLVLLVVADSGTIRRSADGGATWSAVPSGTGQRLSAVWIQGPTAIAAGTSGTLLRSTDAGVTWSPVASGTTEHLSGVWGWGATVVAVGAGGRIQRSTDGGLSWSPVDSGTTATFTDVSGAGSTVVATDGSSRILRSWDGGATWHALDVGGNAALRSISMVSPENVIAVGDRGLILRGTR